MGDVISLSAYARGPGAGMHLAPGEDVLRLRPRQLDGARSPAAKVGTAPHRVPVRWFLRPLPEGAERRMALWCAAALLALAALSGALSCSPARAAEPLPDLRAAHATLDRALPVLLSGRATEDAVLTVALHQGRVSR